jgi:hypothetical protein
VTTAYVKFKIERRCQMSIIKNSKELVGQMVPFVHFS